MSSAATLHRAVVHRKAGRVYLVQEEEPARRHPIGPEEGVTRTAAAALMLASYRNQSVHVFVRPAMLAMAMRVTRATQRGEGSHDVFLNYIHDRENETLHEHIVLNLEILEYFASRTGCHSFFHTSEKCQNSY